MATSQDYWTTAAQRKAVLAVARSMTHAEFLAALLDLVMRGEIHSHAGGIALNFTDER